MRLQKLQKGFGLKIKTGRGYQLRPVCIIGYPLSFKKYAVIQRLRSSFKS
jgi:hypothetical protein